MTLSLYDRLGGAGALSKAIAILYDKLLADELTRPFFEKLEMQALIRKQVSFMARTLGGPDEFQGRDLRAAHANLVFSRNLGDPHFDAVVKHLAETLREMGVENELIEEVAARVEPMRDHVLGPRANRRS